MHLGQALIDRLSPRRRQVLELITKGLTNDEIASALVISPTTVRTHITTLLAALEVTNRTEAAALFASLSARPVEVERILARPAIAVLPLEVLDESAAARLVGAGLSRDLGGLFSRWACFPVIAHTSTVGVRAAGGTAQEIGQRLGARFLVDGALRTDGVGWRLLVRLDDTESGLCIWSEDYDFDRCALFSVQDDVCAKIVAASYQVMMAHALRPSRVQPGSDVAAWESAHQGMALQALRERDANAQAQECFGAAIAREPGLVLAHFGLGLCHYDESLNQWRSRERAWEQLGLSAERCIALAPHAAEGYFLLGRYWQARGEHQRGQAPLEAAIGRNPSFAAGHALLGQVLLLTGQVDEGIARMKHATRLGPGAFVAGLAVAHFLRNENAEALAAAERALVSRPDYTFARVLAAASAYWQGDEIRAAQHAHELQRRHSAFEPERFLESFGTRFDGVNRIAVALRALIDLS